MRQWLIQCKREKEIGPKKLVGYLEAIPEVETSKLYGVIIAAACDISKKARDHFRLKCTELGFSECYIWSAAEIEDMLYQPKNDGILFAYFGISLAIKRRTAASRLRSRLAAKRKLQSIFEEDEIGSVALFLDPDDTTYPYITEQQKYKDLTWKFGFIDSYDPWGILIQLRSYFAFLDDDGAHWDIADAFDDVPRTLTHVQWGQWVDLLQYIEQTDLRDEVVAFHNSLPPQNKGIAVVKALLQFEEIIDVDKTGDPFFPHPILYVTMRDGDIPYASATATLSVATVFSERVGKELPPALFPARSLELLNNQEGRVHKFPEHLRKPSGSSPQSN
jgi:hypothetical protein